MTMPPVVVPSSFFFLSRDVDVGSRLDGFGDLAVFCFGLDFDT